MKKIIILILGVMIQFSIINIAPAPPIEIGNIGGNEHDTAAVYTTQETENRIDQLSATLTEKINAVKQFAEEVDERATLNNFKSFFDKAFPVDSIYITYANQYPPLHNDSEYHISWEALPEKYAIMTANGGNTGTVSGNLRLDSATTGATTLTVDQIPAHSHISYISATRDGFVSPGQGTNWGWFGTLTNQATTNTGGGQAHTHPLNIFNQKLMFWKRVS